MTNGTLTFGEAATLVRDTVQPAEVGGMPYIGLGHIEAGRLCLSGFGKAEDTASAKFRFSQDDILFGKLRPYFRKVIRAPFDGICSTDIWVVRATSEADQGYLYYWMASAPFVDFATRGSEGTRMPRAKWEHVSRYEQKRLPIGHQRAIARILGSLDDKIELNQKMNRTLEAIGQALFKRWFVDFEFPNYEGKPYKSSGGEMVDSELGAIPKKWEVKSVSDVVNIEYGKNLPTKRLLSKGYPVFGGNGIIGYYKEYLYRDPQVIVACRGAASGRILLTYPNSFVTNNSLVLNIKTTEYLDFHYLKRYCDNADLSVYVTGSAQPQITIQNLSDFQILAPSEEQVVIYRKIVSPVDEQIYRNVLETKTLAKTRDSLLPRLMSGRIRVGMNL